MLITPKKFFLWTIGLVIAYSLGAFAYVFLFRPQNDCLIVLSSESAKVKISVFNSSRLIQAAEKTGGVCSRGEFMVYDFSPSLPRPVSGVEFIVTDKVQKNKLEDSGGRVLFTYVIQVLPEPKTAVVKIQFSENLLSDKAKFDNLFASFISDKLYLLFNRERRDDVATKLIEEFDTLEELGIKYEI